MRCFEHRSTEAIGFCRGCGKAVCDACFTDTGFGLACGSVCDARVRSDRALVVRSKKAMGGGHVFTTVMGSIFAVPSTVLSLLALASGDFMSALLWLPTAAVGVLFVAWGRHNRLRHADLESLSAPRLPEPASHDDRR